jgi:hypothetical protein
MRLKLEVMLSAHAIARFRDRLRPALTHRQAAGELQILLGAFASTEFNPPPWVDVEPWTADFWLLVGDDIALPVRDGTAVTLLTRGAQRPGARRHSTRAKREARQARRAISDDLGRKRRDRERKAQPTRERQRAHGGRRERHGRDHRRSGGLVGGDDEDLWGPRAGLAFAGRGA